MTDLFKIDSEILPLLMLRLKLILYMPLGYWYSKCIQALQICQHHWQYHCKHKKNHKNNRNYTPVFFAV